MSEPGVHFERIKHSPLSCPAKYSMHWHEGGLDQGSSLTANPVLLYSTNEYYE
jgi:hypothetical protein